jgi:hypothetical protein
MMTINGALPDPVENPPGDFPDEATTRENVTIGFFGDGDQLVSVDSKVIVDGVTVGDFAESGRNTEYRRESPEGGFSYVVPQGNWSGVPLQTVAPAVADGYWFAYDTASFAQNESHTVNFIGDYADGGFILNVTYNILNQIEGTNGKDNLNGTKGNDYIDGGDGPDKLMGLKGDDLIVGGDGADVIDGGKGNDELWGDGGLDTFIFKRNYGNDKIFDFEPGEVIEIKGFSEIPDPVDIDLPSGVSAAQIDFGQGDTLTFVNVASDDLSVNLPDGTITL